jgi:hypothetical protein
LSESFGHIFEKPAYSLSERIFTGGFAVFFAQIFFSLRASSPFYFSVFSRLGALVLLLSSTALAQTHTKNIQGQSLEHSPHETSSAKSAVSVPTIELIGSKSLDAKPTRLAFQLNQNGKILTAKDLATVHEKKLHVLIYDQSLSEFFHVHPTEKKGIWTTEEVPFSTNGKYKVWAE